jgi:hypothetical protein
MSRHASEHLLHAYRQTSFLADTPLGQLVLRIGSRNKDLDKLLQDLAVRTWAFITAFNPGSRSLSQEENRWRQRLMEDRVRQLGLRTFGGQGVGDDGRWPAEESLLIVGISREDAIALGREFGQAALVYGRTGSLPELVEIHQEGG